MLSDVERQFDHFFRFQPGWKDPIEHVAFHGGCRELDNARRIEPPHHLAGKLGNHLVRFIHQHQRPQLMRHIHKGIQHTPVLSPVQIGIRTGEPLKMLLEVFIMPVNLPGVLVAFLDPERLHGGNDNAGCPKNIGRPDVVDILNVENRHPLHPERRAQRFPAGMGRIPQRLYRLPAYGVGRNQP